MLDVKGKTSHHPLNPMMASKCESGPLTGAPLIKLSNRSNQYTEKTDRNYHQIKIAIRMDILMILLNYTSMIVIVVAFLLAIYKHTHLSS